MEKLGIFLLGLGFLMILIGLLLVGFIIHPTIGILFGGIVIGTMGKMILDLDK